MIAHLVTHVRFAAVMLAPQWYFIVAQHAKSKAFAIVGPFASERQAIEQAEWSKAPYYRIGTKKELNELATQIPVAAA